MQSYVNNNEHQYKYQQRPIYLRCINLGAEIDISIVILHKPYLSNGKIALMTLILSIRIGGGSV